MNEHPINSFMENAMAHLKTMVDVNTIVGDPLTAPDGTIIIPVSKVGFGIATGGSDFVQKANQDARLFGGGSGAGVSISPIAFLVVGKNSVRLIPVTNSLGTADRIIDAIPMMVDKVNGMIQEYKDRKKGTSAFDEE